MIEAHTTLSEPYSLVLRKLCNEYVAGKPVLKEIDLTFDTWNIAGQDQRMEVAGMKNTLKTSRHMLSGRDFDAN